MEQIEKLTESEARALVRDSKFDWEMTASEIIRKCFECGAYVAVTDMSGECVIEGKTYFDICSDCADRLEKGAAIKKFTADDCDDLELCEYCGQPILDDEETVYSGDDEPYHENCAARQGIKPEDR